MILDYRKITGISEITDPGYDSGGQPVYVIRTWGPQGDHMLKVESPVWDQTAADKGDTDPIRLADLELYDEMLRWTSEAFKMVMDPEVRNNRFIRPKSPEYISTGFGFDSFAVLDHENRKAYFWHNNEKKWKQSGSLYVETEWGSEPYKSLELIPGSETSLES